MCKTNNDYFSETFDYFSSDKIKAWIFVLRVFSDEIFYIVRSEGFNWESRLKRDVERPVDQVYSI